MLRPISQNMISITPMPTSDCAIDTKRPTIALPLLLRIWRTEAWKISSNSASAAFTRPSSHSALAPTSCWRPSCASPANPATPVSNALSKGPRNESAYRIYILEDQAKVGETIRLYFGVGGPNLTSSFHVIGAIFDRVYGDGEKLEQSICHLLDNAVKFTASGTVTLSCHLNDECNQLDFIVEDTGIGIAEQEQERIFDMYYKSNDGRRLSIIGSGIGLSVSRALVEAMQGRISVSSVIGKGSRFAVVLPTDIAQQEQQAAISCPELTVLLIEDVPLNAEIATALLEQRGHTVILAETGEDAIALLETEDDIDLVLLDMQLPDMDGEQIAKYIREEPHLASLPIVILSANVRKAEQQLANLHINDALAKPINTARLDQMLARLFSPSAVKLLQAKDTAEVTEPQLLDQATLNDYIQSLGKDAVKRSAQLFAQLLPGYMNRLMETAVQRHLTEFQEAAHKLKGAAASVGLLWVQQQAKRFEQETVNWQGLERQLVDFHLQTEQHLAALFEYIDQA